MGVTRQSAVFTRRERRSNIATGLQSVLAGRRLRPPAQETAPFNNTVPRCGPAAASLLSPALDLPPRRMLRWLVALRPFCCPGWQPVVRSRTANRRENGPGRATDPARTWPDLTIVSPAASLMDGVGAAARGRVIRLIADAQGLLRSQRDHAAGP